MNSLDNAVNGKIAILQSELDATRRKLTEVQAESAHFKQCYIDQLMVNEDLVNGFDPAGTLPEIGQLVYVLRADGDLLTASRGDDGSGENTWLWADEHGDMEAFADDLPIRWWHLPGRVTK